MRFDGVCSMGPTSVGGGEGLPYDRVALVLQGGGALGAYQVGVYRALEELGLCPDWVAGHSIGAVNAAIIAGSRPEERVRRLEEFWGSISYPLWWPWPGMRAAHNTLSTLRTVVLGNPGFSRPRPVNPWLAPPGVEGAVSYFDPAPLHGAIERFVDFDRIRDGQTRLTVGAVNVRTGRLRYFDSAQEAIGLEHVLASIATPPAFPPVEIDGEWYWHGGVVGNTPLDAVLDANPRVDTLCVMVDLFSPEGAVPSGMDEVMVRLGEIGYASRTDMSLTQGKEKHDLRLAIAALVDALPEETRHRPEIQAMAELGCTTTMNVVRLAFQPAHLEWLSGEFDYSRLSTEDHMGAGYADAMAGCSELQRFTRPSSTPLPAGVFIHDITHADSANEAA
jgi:NTE family protein